MKINEIISEAFSLENTMSSIAADIGNGVTDTFDALKASASNWMGGHDSLKGWGFVSSSVETRMWWDRIWAPVTNPKKGSSKPNPGLQGELYDLSRQAGRSGQPLAAFLRDMITGRGSFVRLSSTLPTMLISIGQAHGNDNLVTKAKKWQEELRDFQAWLADLESARPSKSSKKNQDEPKSEPVSQLTAKPASMIPGQNVAAEKIVSDVLRGLPAGVAGDIRQAIAKSSNKIQALQVELSKRGIKL
jgi:hypothetical protein